MRKNLVGRRFGRWLVVDFSGIGRGRNSLWKCKCDCGAEKVVRIDNLECGDSKSCGCLHKEIVAALKFKHGMAKRTDKNNRLYRTWQRIKNRCADSRGPFWDRYGGRGIRVCEEWWEFSQFAKDMGDPPTPAHSIDRIDNNGDYGPNNCKWSTPSEQASNTSRTIVIEHDGVKDCLAGWARRIGISRTGLIWRINKYGKHDERTFAH